MDWVGGWTDMKLGVNGDLKKLDACCNTIDRLPCLKGLRMLQPFLDIT
jgi:hypothetical protein